MAIHKHNGQKWILGKAKNVKNLNSKKASNVKKQAKDSRVLSLYVVLLLLMDCHAAKAARNDG